MHFRVNTSVKILLKVLIFQSFIFSVSVFHWYSNVGIAIQMLNAVLFKDQETLDLTKARRGLQTFKSKLE